MLMSSSTFTVKVLLKMHLIPSIGKSYKYSMGYTFYILCEWNYSKQ